MTLHYVVRISFWGDGRRAEKIDVAVFHNKKDALDYEANIDAEIQAARRLSDLITVEARSIETSSGLKIYKTQPLLYDDRKKLEEPR